MSEQLADLCAIDLQKFDTTLEGFIALIEPELLKVLEAVRRSEIARLLTVDNVRPSLLVYMKCYLENLFSIISSNVFGNVEGLWYEQ